MPDRLYRGYTWLWHLLSLGILTLTLGTALWDTRTVWGGRQAALVGLVSLQMALYLKTFVLSHPWPLPWWWLSGYFLGSLGLWLIEGRLDTHFSLLCLMYLGQMHLLVPPRLTIPATILLLGTFWGLHSGWNFSRLPRDWGVHTFVLWTVLAVLFSYARHMGQTSRERARLIAKLQAENRTRAADIARRYGLV